MIFRWAKRVAATMPAHWQQEMKRLHFRRQIKRRSFRTPEPEWDLLQTWLKPGDWAIDVGANIGHYTLKLSEIVGATGRVIAFEPVPATFELLAANVAQSRYENVTALNLAASDATRVVGISIPRFAEGLTNYYEARLTEQADAQLQVMSCAIDALALPGRVRLVKIDAEGHDETVMRGAMQLLRRDKPILLIESVSAGMEALLASLGYEARQQPGSPNTILSVPAT